MGMSLEDVLQRTKIEGKDSLDQFSQVRENFVRDICREITTSLNFNWLEEIITITSSADGTWVNLPTNVLKIAGVMINNRPLQPISEELYFKMITRLVPTNSGDKAFYRSRWYDVTRRKQITFVGVSTGTTVTLLIRKFYDDPGKLPDELEEAVVQGTLFKFNSFLEGDDTQVAITHYQRYQGILKQLYDMTDEQLIDDDADRVMTNDEIENIRSYPYVMP